MDKSELLKTLSSLSPSKKSIPQALAFLRLTAINNKSKKPEVLRARADVLQASSLIGAWISTVEETINEFAKDLPKVAAKQLLNSVDSTLTKLKSDVSLDNIADWQKSDNGVKWASRIILRMTYLLDVLEKQVDLTTKSKFKTWNCRMLPTSCNYCKALNGVTIRRHASFSKFAKAAGFKNVYAGLYGPGLHPNCRCYLTFSDTKDN